MTAGPNSRLLLIVVLLHACILLHLAIDRHGNEPPGRLVQKMDDLMPLPGELSSFSVMKGAIRYLSRRALQALGMTGPPLSASRINVFRAALI